MEKYVLSYYSGDMPLSEEENNRHMGKYQEWMKGLGDAIVEPDKPVVASKLVGPDRTIKDDTINHWMGFCIITAKDMDAAVKIAQACPFLDIGGSIQVDQLMEM